MAFTAPGPWLLVGVWLTTAISSDWTTCPVANNIAVVLSAAYGACKILQSIFTTPYLYSTLVWNAMRFLPERLSPDFDAETMWSRAEVLKWYRVRNQETQEKGKCRACKIPNFARKLLSTLWMSVYAEMRINSEQREKLETVYELYNHEITSEFEGNVGFRDKLRCLFFRWAIRTQRDDPQPDNVNRNGDSEASNNVFHSIYQNELHHLDNSCNELEAVVILKLLEQCKPEQDNVYPDALRGYLEFLQQDPFQKCLISQLDLYGNTCRSPYLRSPVGMIESEVVGDHHGMCTGANGGEKMQERGMVNNDFDPQWMMTPEEKRMAMIQDLRDSVWQMANQNYSYIERSKAL
ncbi:hypothetical protein Aduo_013306 [Ancylostoma duodenale]